MIKNNIQAKKTKQNEKHLGQNSSLWLKKIFHHSLFPLNHVGQRQKRAVQLKDSRFPCWSDWLKVI